MWDVSSSQFTLPSIFFINTHFSKYVFLFSNYLTVPEQEMVVILSLLAHPLLSLPGNFLRVGSNAWN